MATTNTIFKAFEADDIVRSNYAEVTTGLWTGDTGSLSAFYTSSVQISGSSGQYYVDVYNANPTGSADVQFSVAYGNRLGGGAPTLSQDSSATLSSQATYSQYRNMLLQPTDTQFTFGTYNSDNIIVVNMARARTRETLDPGNFQISLSGSGGKFSFIDSSNLSLANGPNIASVYAIVSGSLTGPSGSTVALPQASVSHGNFGLVYPDIGVMVFNLDALVEVGAVAASAFITGSTPTPVYNHLRFVDALNGAASFLARSSENISSTQLYVRIRNKEFNYSNNPSFYDKTSGAIINPAFVQNPVVYITTVGLYNDNNELIAVAKLSKPLKKSFNEEQLIKIRLDW